MSEFLERIAGLSQKRLALLADGLRQKLETAEQQAKEPIAIIGMSCRFPGAPDIETFWQLLSEGRETIREVPAERWNIDEWYDSDPEAHGKMYCRKGGFLESLDMFDPHFFSISPREAMSMDPQQRLLLELSWEAFEDAGLSASAVRGSNTGVFAGIGPSHYVGGMRIGEPEKMDMYSGIGNSSSVAVGRVSFVFDLTGPNFPVETACSSSLVATHVACRSLRNRECNMALAGGVHIMLAPEQTAYFCRLGVLSRTDRSRAFDAEADGFVRSEGCGIVVLKRYADAVADGDRIWGVIRGSAVNHDAHGTGLLVPNPAAQEAVIKEAMANAGVTPADVGYIEAHGTGTSIGDPVELAAFKSVFDEDRDADDPLIIGSVKTNVGHLELAAGIAGLIKVVLSLNHKQIPAHLNFENPTPLVDWNALPVRIPTETEEWEPRNGRRLAGVSSYGFSGTNVHAVVEEAPELSVPDRPFKRPAHLLCLSAHTEDALIELADRMQAKPMEDMSVEDICYTTNAGRTHYECRVAFHVKSHDDIQQGLQAVAAGDMGTVGGLSHVAHPDSLTPVFLFTGQGAQYVDMGRELYETQPRFREIMDTCDAMLRDELEKPLLDVLYPENEQDSPINQTAYAQPALFSIEYALAELWRSWGVEPGAVMGHSIGEIAAACVAGVFSLNDALSLVAARGRLMQALPGGGKMAVLMADEDTVNQILSDIGGDISIAAINGPTNTVISGAGPQVDRVVRKMESDGVKHQYLKVSHAFHSPLIEPMLDEFEQFISGIEFASPQLPIISNVSGDLAHGDETTTAAYWRNHIRQAVRFSDGMRCLDDNGYSLFIEVGPQPTLLAMGRRCVNDHGQHWLPSLRQPHADWQHLLESVRQLHLLGYEFGWKDFDRGYPRKIVFLPHYPYERVRLWIESSGDVARGRRHLEGESLLGSRVLSPNGSVQFESSIRGDSPAVSAGPAIDELGTISIGSLLQLGIEGAQRGFADTTWAIRDFTLHAPIALGKEERRVMQSHFRANGEGGVEFTVYTHDDEQGAHPNAWMMHASGQLCVENGASNGTEADIQAVESLIDADGFRPIDTAPLMSEASENSNNSPVHRIEYLARRNGEVIAHLTQTASDNTTQQAIDAALKALSLARDVDHRMSPSAVSNVDSLQIYTRPTGASWHHVTVESCNGCAIKGTVQVLNDDGSTCILIRGAALVSLQEAKQALLAAQVDHWLYRTEWMPKTLDHAPEPDESNGTGTGAKAGYWLVFADRNGFAQALTEKLRPHPCVLVRPNTGYRREEEGTFHVDPENGDEMRRLLTDIAEIHGKDCLGILHCWCLDNTNDVPRLEDLDVAAQTGCASLFNLVNAMAEGPLRRETQLRIVTRGARCVHPDAVFAALETTQETVAVAQAPVWGLALSIAAEFPNIRSACIDLDPDEPIDDQQTAQAIARELRATPVDDQVALRDGRRFVARLNRMPRPDVAATANDPAPRIDPEATYLITGGFGGIGLIMAQWLAERGARNLVLIGRRGATQTSREIVDALKGQGVTVMEAKADVADRADMERLFADMREMMPPLKGILHAAGLLDEGLLTQQDWTRFKGTLAPKVAGTWNIHELTAGMQLDFLVLFSSTSTLFRTPGLGPYAAANSFLDAFAHYRNSAGLPAVSIHWGSWLEAGMAARREETETKWGIGSLPPQGGLLALEKTLRARWREVGVVPVAWDAFVRDAPEMYQAPFLSRLLPAAAVQAAKRKRAKGPDPVLMELREAARDRRVEILSGYIQEKVARIVGLDSPDQLDLEAPLTDLGIDSLMGFELKSAIELAIGRTVPITTMLENPTIESVVLYLVDEVMEGSVSGNGSKQAPESSRDGGAAEENHGPWFAVQPASSEPELRLFCFPYSGSGASCYRPWAEFMPERVELQIVQYPGRESRMKEPAFSEMPPLVDALEQALLHESDLPYAFFGHSMGALLAFSLCQRLQRNGRPLPEHLFVSACMPPQSIKITRSIFDMSDDDLLEDLRKLGQTPAPVLQNPELMNVYLPLIRADFSVYETFRPDTVVLDCPITAYAGKGDTHAKSARHGGWREWTNKQFNMETFDGDHFFIHSAEDSFMNTFVRSIQAITQGLPEGATVVNGRSVDNFERRRE